MIVTPIKTKKVIKGDELFSLLDDYLPNLKEKTILAVTSKVVSICEGRIIPADSVDKHELVKKESDFYLSEDLSDYGFSFTVVHNTLIPAAGIDESNGDGHYVLWPKDPQHSANEIRAYLKKRFNLNHVGVVITDSTAIPLHWGTKGIAISYSGFLPTNDYISTKDLFGRVLMVTKSNIADSLAAAAVLTMGEGSESTPIATIEDLSLVKFQGRNPTKEELEGFYTDHMKDDLFAPFLQNMGWQKGQRKP